MSQRPAAAALPESDRAVHLSEYVHVLRRHKLLIALALLIAMALGMYHNSRLRPIYRATATMIIGPIPSVQSPEEGTI